MEASTEPQGSEDVSDATVVLDASLLSGAFLLLIVLLPKLAPFLNKCFRRWLPGSQEAEQLSHSVVVQEQQFSDFIDRLHNGPTLASSTQAASDGPAATPPERFFEIAPQPLQSIRTSFAQLSSAADDETLHNILRDMCAETRRLRLFCERPEFRPLWQLTTAFEQLLRQFADKSFQLTPSLLRTFAGALICLEHLCKPGGVWKNASEPPYRFLAVDDDPICRHALASTLKKTFNPPDLAQNGEAALALATQNHYDAIFLDVEMPGMDGFELCSRVHQTSANENTPVVFVTCHSDFDSRCKSTEAGGFDLIAKPFLPEEFIVKALTLVLRRRFLSPVLAELPKAKVSEQVPATRAAIRTSQQPVQPEQRQDVAQVQDSPALTPDTALVRRTDELLQASEFDAAVNGGARNGHESANVAHNGHATSDLRNTRGFAPATPSDRTPQHTAQAFAGGLQVEGPRFRLLREQLQALASVDDYEARKKALGEFFVGLQPIVAKADREGLHSATSVGRALENLVRKLLQRPSYTTVSAISTATAGSGLFEELAFIRTNNSPGTSSLNILIVDDDPISRRALSNALQLMFGRPDVAEGGAAGVARATGKHYDVIFLDIVMPDMDGLTACQKIREIPANKNTPILFVTSENSSEAQARALRSGGDGFIPKPVLPAEIALAAMTFGMNGRLRQQTARPQETDNGEKKTPEIQLVHSC